MVELAKVLRSKNTEPLYFSFDILFDEKEVYEKVIKSSILTKKLISKLYQVNKENISIIDYPAAYSVKITILEESSLETSETRIYMRLSSTHHCWM